MIKKSILILTLLLAIAGLLSYRDQVDIEAVKSWIDHAGWIGAVVFTLLYAIGTVLFFPGSALTVTGGAVYGPIWGTLFNLTGATLGAAVAFVIARYVLGDWVERKCAGRSKQLIEGVEAEGWRFVAFVRLVPLFPFNLLNYMLGLTRINFWQYVLTSFICMFPGCLAYTYIGYVGREALAGESGLIQKGLLGLALLACVAFIPRIVKRIRASGTSH